MVILMCRCYRPIIASVNIFVFVCKERGSAFGLIGIEKGSSFSLSLSLSLSVCLFPYVLFSVSLPRRLSLSLALSNSLSLSSSSPYITLTQ